MVRWCLNGDFYLDTKLRMISRIIQFVITTGYHIWLKGTFGFQHLIIFLLWLVCSLATACLCRTVRINTLHYVNHLRGIECGGIFFFLWDVHKHGQVTFSTQIIIFTFGTVLFLAFFALNLSDKWKHQLGLSDCLHTISSAWVLLSSFVSYLDVYKSEMN